jgi:Tfp pilus assembly protein PilO
MSSVHDRQLRLTSFGLQAGGLIVALGIWGLLIGLAYLPLAAAEDEAAGKLRSTQSFLATSEKIHSEHQRLLREFEILDKQRASIMARIPDGPQEADFLAQVTTTAQACGLQTREYRTGAVSSHPRFQELEIALNMSGNYAGLCRFLDRLHQLPRFCLLSDLHIDAEPGAESLPFEMKLRIFFNEPTKIATSE